MADTPLSGLTPAETAGPSDLVYLTVGGVDRSMTIEKLTTLIGSGVTTSTEVKSFAAREEQSSGTNGGTFTSGAWQDRVLNTLEQHTPSETTLDANELTVPAGKWLLFWSAPAHATGSHQSRIVIDEAGTPSYHLGESCYILGSASVQNSSTGFAIADQSTPFTVKVQHRCEVTRATDGFGRPCSFGTEVYGKIYGIRIGDAT